MWVLEKHETDQFMLEQILPTKVLMVNDSSHLHNALLHGRSTAIP